MTVHSNLLFSGSFGDSSTHTLYTVPTGKRTIVKSIVPRNAGSSAGAVVIGLKNGATSEGNFGIWCTASGTNGDSAVVLPWIVLQVGWSLTVSFPTGSGGWITVSGSELDD